MERPTDERSSPLGHGLLGLSQDVGGGDDPASTSATDRPCAAGVVCPIPGLSAPAGGFLRALSPGGREGLAKMRTILLVAFGKRC
jgi:hypothetical protein